MQRRIKLVALALAALIALFASACSAGSTPSSNGGKLTIGFVAAHFDTYFTSVEQGLKKAAEAQGHTVISVSYNDDAGQEAQAYQNLISRGVNVVVTSPFDAEGSVTGLRNVVNAKIPVICFNTCVKDEAAKQYVSAFIQSDNQALGTSTGTYAATFIKDNLGGAAKVGILNCDTFAVCKLRKAGFVEELKKQGIQANIVADQEAYVPDKTASAAQNMLTAHPEINVMWSATDGGGTGAISAVKSAGLQGKVHVFSTDISSALASALESNDKVLLATTGQDGDAQGTAIMEAVTQAKPGEQVSPYEKLIPGVLFSVDDKAKVSDWAAKNK